MERIDGVCKCLEDGELLHHGGWTYEAPVVSIAASEDEGMLPSSGRGN